jgi:hypothetical protein
VQSVIVGRAHHDSSASLTRTRKADSARIVAKRLAARTWTTNGGEQRTTMTSRFAAVAAVSGRLVFRDTHNVRCSMEGIAKLIDFGAKGNMAQLELMRTQIGPRSSSDSSY